MVSELKTMTGDGNDGSIKLASENKFGVLVVMMECRCKAGKISYDELWRWKWK